MSADNWAMCPRCVKREADTYQERYDEVMATYGKVPVAEFDAARSAAVDEVRPVGATFREDYEITPLEDGEVEVHYKGRCTKCGLSLQFDHAHTIDMDQS